MHFTYWVYTPPTSNLSFIPEWMQLCVRITAHSWGARECPGSYPAQGLATQLCLQPPILKKPLLFNSWATDSTLEKTECLNKGISPLSCLLSLSLCLLSSTCLYSVWPTSREETFPLQVSTMARCLLIPPSGRKLTSIILTQICLILGADLASRDFSVRLLQFKDHHVFPRRYIVCSTVAPFQRWLFQP